MLSAIRKQMISLASKKNFFKMEIDSKITLIDKYKYSSAIWMQHAGAFSASLFAFAVGNVLGWSSPAGPLMTNRNFRLSITEDENSLIASLLTIGAAVSCLPTGYVTDKIGRKTTLLSLIPVFTLGWCLIIWANSVDMIYAGRFFLGLCAGATCITAPVYIAEITQKNIRGITGSYFQLLLSGGILFVYILGSQMELFWFSVICGVMPPVYGIIFVFFPETPVYFLINGKVQEARKSLKFYRDFDTDINQELSELSENFGEKQDIEVSAWNVFKSKQGVKSLTMAIAMMVFQQMSGINAVVFNATDIFKNAGSSLEPRYETIITGVMQVVGTLFATFMVDRIGRVMLLGASASCMAMCTFFLGIYFYLMDINFEVFTFSWVPLVSLCIFIVTFSFGYGAVPWMLMPELIPSKIKGISSSIACTTNWLSAFMVTNFFNSLSNFLGRGVTFWIFSAISALSALFSYKVLPETKGKSLEEIQRELLGV